MADVEFITKHKRPRTSKSGASSQSSGPESAIRELVNASQWWTEMAEEFWKTAAQSKVLIPVISEECKKLSPTMTVDAAWLEMITKKLPEYRAALRKGVLDDYEAGIMQVLELLVGKILNTTTADEAKAKGFTALLGPLHLALDVVGIGSSNVVPEMKQKLTSWYGVLQEEFAVESFKEEVARIQSNPANQVDWQAVSLRLSEVNGMDRSAELVENAKGTLGKLVESMCEKARPVATTERFCMFLHWVCCFRCFSGAGLVLILN